jgi:hypothetical protein
MPDDDDDGGPPPPYDSDDDVPPPPPMNDQGIESLDGLANAIKTSLEELMALDRAGVEAAAKTAGCGVTVRKKLGKEWEAAHGGEAAGSKRHAKKQAKVEAERREWRRGVRPRRPRPVARPRTLAHRRACTDRALVCACSRCWCVPGHGVRRRLPAALPGAARAGLRVGSQPTVSTDCLN